MEKRVFLIAVLCISFVSLYAAPDWTIENGVNYITGSDEYYQVWINNTAELKVSGGSATYIYTDNTSILNITGGDIYQVESNGLSVVSISSGSVRKMYCYDESTVNVYGWDNSEHALSSSNFHVIASGNSVINFFQGNEYGQLNAYGDSIVNIYGTNLEFNSSYLTGTWVDGTDFQFYMRGQFELPSNIVLHEIPEPATLALLGFGMFLLKRRIS